MPHMHVDIYTTLEGGEKGKEAQARLGRAGTAKAVRDLKKGPRTRREGIKAYEMKRNKTFKREKS